MTENVYLDDFRMEVAQSAWDAYVGFREELTDAEAQQRIKLLHFAHIRRMIAGDMLAGDGAVIVTDIPSCDLALVDAHFPALKQRHVALFSRQGADFVIGVLARSGHRVPQVQ